MISEAEYRGGSQIVGFTGNDQTKLLAYTKGRLVQLPSSATYTGCEIVLPYAPMLRTGGPIFTFFQFSNNTAVSIVDFLGVSTGLTIPVKPAAWIFLCCTVYLLHNVGTGGTWRWTFRRGWPS